MNGFTKKMQWLLVKVKNNIKPLSVGGIGGLVLCFFPFLSSLSAEMEQVIPVELKVVGETLKIDQSNRCKSDQHPGCLHFARDTKAYIGFYIHNQNLGKSCDTGADHVITKIELATTELKTEEKNNKRAKGDFTKEVDSWLKKAFSSVDMQTGIIYEEEWPLGWTQVVVENLNSHDAKKGMKSFWYQVTVTDCVDEKNTWITDPRGDNEGKN